MKTKVLITGATGFVGANLLRRLLKRECEVYILMRNISNAWRISDVMENVHQVDVDLRDEKKIYTAMAEVRPEIIFHFANAGVYGGKSASDRELAEVNFIGLINLLSALDAISYKAFINIGSSSEYGPKDTPMKESDVCEPASAYGVSKLAATNYASFVAKAKDRPIITLRLFSPYGPYDDSRRLIPKVIHSLIEKEDLILTNPHAKRDYVFIDDVIDLLEKAPLKANALRGEVFNVGAGVECEIGEVVSLIIGRIGGGAQVEWGAMLAHPGESPRWQADISKTSRAFGWEPRHSLEGGVRKTIDWFMAHRNLFNDS